MKPLPTKGEETSEAAPKAGADIDLCRHTSGPSASAREAARALDAAVPAARSESYIPWRARRTPYRIFLAEFLLVRTRSDVVIDRFEAIVARFPDVAALAATTEDELTEVLRPLGMLKRIPLLIRAAGYLLEQHGGEIPTTVPELAAVPGLGLYTSTAIAAFAYGSLDVPADVNILRFLSRVTGMPMTHATKGSAELRELLPLLSANQGGPPVEQLLDFTRLVCTPRRPRCEECPVAAHCAHFRRAHLVATTPSE